MCSPLPLAADLLHLFKAQPPDAATNYTEVVRRRSISSTQSREDAKNKAAVCLGNASECAGRPLRALVQRRVPLPRCACCPAGVVPSCPVRAFQRHGGWTKPLNRTVQQPHPGRCRLASLDKLRSACRCAGASMSADASMRVCCLRFAPMPGQNLSEHDTSRRQVGWSVL